MKTNPRVRTRQDAEVKTGTVLLAKPFWNDETYKRSVVLLIHHGNDGSTGIILNKMSNLSVRDALPELDHRSTLFYGGPVNKKTISYVHTNPNIPDTFYLGNGLFWGGNYEFVLEKYRDGKLSLKDFHFCAGFVEWSAGELEAELRDEKWWASELTRQELFLLPPEELWSDKLVEDEHLYGLFNYYPDPSLN